MYAMPMVLHVRRVWGQRPFNHTSTRGGGGVELVTAFLVRLHVIQYVRQSLFSALVRAVALGDGKRFLYEPVFAEKRWKARRRRFNAV